MQPSRQIFMMGGGSIRRLETLPLDREVVRLSGKKRPSVLFVPTATGDPEEYVDRIRRMYGQKLGCPVDALRLIADRPGDVEIRRKIDAADVIYVGGGNTHRMLRWWRARGVDRLMRRAWDRGALLTGMSAGGICWCRSGMSDSFTDRWTRVRGIGLLPVDHNPHANEAGRKRGAPAFARKHRIRLLEIDNMAAVHFRDETFRVVSERAGRWARVRGARGRADLPASGTMTELHSLLR